eukprot:366469-Chlamydomonas_euryale.AAC.10
MTLEPGTSWGRKSGGGGLGRRAREGDGLTLNVGLTALNPGRSCTHTSVEATQGWGGGARWKAKGGWIVGGWVGGGGKVAAESCPVGGRPGREDVVFTRARSKRQGDPRHPCAEEARHTFALKKPATPGMPSVFSASTHSRRQVIPSLPTHPEATSPHLCTEEALHAGHAERLFCVHAQQARVWPRAWHKRGIKQCGRRAGVRWRRSRPWHLRARVCGACGGCGGCCGWGGGAEGAGDAGGERGAGGAEGAGVAGGEGGAEGAEGDAGDPLRLTACNIHPPPAMQPPCNRHATAMQPPCNRHATAIQPPSIRPPPHATPMQPPCNPPPCNLPNPAPRPTLPHAPPSHLQVRRQVALRLPYNRVGVGWLREELHAARRRPFIPHTRVALGRRKVRRKRWNRVAAAEAAARRRRRVFHCFAARRGLRLEHQRRRRKKFEQERRGQRTAVFGPPARRVVSNHHVRLQSLERGRQRRLRPRPPQERRRCGRRHERLRGDAAERELGLGDLPSLSGGRRRQLHAHAGVDNRDVVLTARALLELAHILMAARKGHSNAQ